MNRSKVLKAAFVVAALGATGYLLWPYLRLEWLFANYTAMTTFVRTHFGVALGVFFISYVAVVAFSLPFALAMTLLGGALFGGIAGGLTALFAATTGATLLFLAARGLLHDYFVRKSGPWLERLRKEFHADAASYLLLLRLTPIFPFAVVNLAAGLFGARLLTFVWTTFVGISPGTTAYSYIGSGLGGVLETEAARLATCRSQASAVCETTFNPSSFVSRDVGIGLGALGLLVLVSIIVRRRSRGAGPVPGAAPRRDPE